MSSSAIQSQTPVSLSAQEQLSQASISSEATPAPAPKRSIVSLWHRMVAEAAGANDQTESTTSVVASLSEHLPDHTVRLVWGQVDSLRNGREESSNVPVVTATRAYDSRLGWLGADNAVYQRLRESIESVEVTPDGGLKGKMIGFESANVMLRLHSDQYPDRIALLVIRPPADSAELVEVFVSQIQLSQLAMLASVMHSRPVTRRFMKVAERLNVWWSRRGLLGIALLSVIAIGFIPIRYRIDSVAHVRAMDSRVVASPIAATLSVVHVRPGDQVKVGQPLVELDGRPLRIELEGITAEIDEATKDEDIALAGGRIADAQLATLRRKTMSRRRDLIVDRLARLIVVSPIDGIVIQGDLEETLGSPLEVGQSLLELAPEGSVEIELEIPEVEIGFVETDAEVSLWFPAAGESDLKTNVQTVWPSASIRDDENVFVAKSPMPEADASELKVGMRGEAIVYGPTCPWVWRYIRTTVSKIGWMIGW